MGTTTGVCPTVEQALAKVKDNLRANILVTDELASHIVDALTKVYTDQGTLEGTAALEQFLEIMSDNGKYTEAPKEIMDLIVLQLNTVYNVAPQCWNWAHKFGFDKDVDFKRTILAKKGVCPTLEEQLEKVKKNLAASDKITDELAGHIVDALIKVAKELKTLEGKAAHDRFVEIMSDNGKYTEAPKEVMDLIVEQLKTVFADAPACWTWAHKFGFDKDVDFKRGAPPVSA